jgi:hypothetical protein
MPQRGVSLTTRLPDFMIIGTMKSGTTTLYRWLEAQPEIFLPTTKEPNFFSDETRWARGLSWYGDLFAGAGAQQLAGEASVAYTSPRWSEVAAPRIAETLPTVRLIYLVRHPIERLRSQYRHQVQRGRERRSLPEALRDPDNEYVGHSRYFSCLRPYISAFPREQLCVVRFEDLVSESAPAWRSVVRALGVPDRPAPKGAHNVTGAKRQFTRPMLWLWERELLGAASRLPGPVRRLGKRLLTRGGTSYSQQIRRSLAPIPAELERTVWEDIVSLEDWLGAGPLWER